MNEHLGLKPYKCKHCPNVYQNSGNCMSHERKSHRDQYTGSKKGLIGVRVKDRDLGLIDIKIDLIFKGIKTLMKYTVNKHFTCNYDAFLESNF